MSAILNQLPKGYIMVTGGSRGIGAAVCELAANDGYDVCINYRSNEQQAQAVAERVRQLGRKATVVQADIGNTDEIPGLFRAADEALGTLVGLVNNAGTGGFTGRVDEISATDLHAIFALNVVGSFACAGEAIRRMSTRHGGSGGGIVNMSSAAARLGAAGRNVHYAASKRALEALTFGLAQEVAAESIRVNSVSPGVIDTEIHSRERLSQMAPQLPMKRPGTAEEVARTVMWLLSPAASYVSGTNVGVSGAR